jgi:hypothetical protein
VVLNFTKYTPAVLSPGETFHTGTGAYAAVEQVQVLQGLQNIYSQFSTNIQFSLDPAEITQLFAEGDSAEASLLMPYVTIPAAVYQSDSKNPYGGGDGNYVTVYYNDTPVFNGQPAPGGFSNEVDFGNLNQKTTVQLDVNGFLGTGIGLVPDSGADASNGLSDFVNMSITISAHEVGHTLGLEHMDALGPIGSGIANPPGAAHYFPDYAGPLGAFTTQGDVIASPASVGSTLVNAADGLAQLGARDAITLAFINGGTTVASDATDPSNPSWSGMPVPTVPAATDGTDPVALDINGVATIVSAQPVSLYDLSVPNPLTTGMDAGKTFAVSAVNIDGYVGGTQVVTDAAGNPVIDATTGNPYTASVPNCYTFTGQAGQLMSFQAMSTSITSIKDPVDTVMTIYGPDGHVVASNDDQFEPSDSSVFDVTLPTTGTYTVEVAAFHSSDPSFNTPGAQNYLPAAFYNAEHGAYELFMYTFSAYNANPGSDTIQYPTMTTLASSASSGAGVYGQPLTLTATVTGNKSTPPTGAVDFYQGTTELGSEPLVSGTGQATYMLTAAQTAALVVGSYAFSTTYVGNSANLTSTTTQPLKLAVTQATATLALSNLAQTYNGQPEPVTVTTSPPGLSGVSVTYNGSSTPPTAPGSYSVVASLGNANYTATSATGTLVINVVGPPTANAQSATTAEGMADAITLTGSDPDTPPLPLTYTVTTNPAHGTLSGTAPNLTYTPAPSFFGPDSFQFTTSNGPATSIPATVSIDIVGTPAADAQAVTLAQDTARPITLTGLDPNSPPLALTFTVTTNPAHGTLSGTAPNLTYTPASSYFGPDSFQFTAGNGTATSAAATVALTVVGQPTANAQSVTTAQDTAKSITLSGLDPNTPPLTLTYTVTVDPTHGLLSGTAPNLTYTPNNGYFGPDSFQFTTGNGTATSTPATVALTVIGQPTANAQSVTTAQGTAKSITLSGLDPNTPPLTLTYTVTVSPRHGMLSGTAPNLTYTPNNGYFGPDSFQFTAGNGTATSATATVALTVIGQPTANAQSVTTAQDTAKSITLSGLDPNSPPLTLTYTVAVNPTHGTLSGTAPYLTYTPNNGYFGPDSFQFTAGNGTATSATATVALTVIGQPAANALSVTMAQGAARDITLAGTDPNTPPLALTYTVTTNPAHGMLTGTAPALTYTPSSGYSGSDSFQFKVNNGTLDSSVATVTLTITPTAHNSSDTTTENRPLAVPAPGVLGNDVGAGDALTAILVNGPTHGTLAFKSDGSFTYTPSVNYHGADSFTYRPVVGALAGNLTTVSLTVTPLPTQLLPRTPYFNYLRTWRSLDPARFDRSHPRIGAVLGLETTGPPAVPTQLVPANDHFNAASARARYARNPQRFTAQHPLLGVLYGLESPGTGLTPTQLLGSSPQMNAARARYAQNPTVFDEEHPYLGAVFALEDIENGDPPAISATTTRRSVQSDPPPQPVPGKAKPFVRGVDTGGGRGRLG